MHKLKTSHSIRKREKCTSTTKLLRRKALRSQKKQLKEKEG